LLSGKGRDRVRTVACFGVQVAEALDHAHTRGILHRDIKPGNLLLDLQGQLWVADFGLAQIQGNPCLTLTGDILGTLRYMSPEQALAKRVVIDGRTDIYSLGVTLYELLTLRPAIEGHDRQEILRKIAQEEPTPIRQLNPAVPRDLETIVMKAVAKEPGGRYATAKDLADELERFIQDRSILARPPSVFDRTAKWARRHKASVWSAGVSVALLLLMAIGGLAASNVFIMHERNQKDGALKARETALAAAEANLLLARQAVDEMYTRVAEDIAGQPHMQLFQRDILEKALRFYQQFARRKSGDDAIQRETAAALLRVGSIQHRLGRFHQARQACDEAITALATSTAALPADLQRRVLLAEAYHSQGRILASEGRRPQAEKAQRYSLQLWGELVAEHPDNLQYRSSLAAANEALSGLLLEYPREAERTLREAIRLYSELVQKQGDQTAFRFSLCSSYCSLGLFLSTMARLPEAESALRQAAELLDRASGFAGRPDWQWQRGEVELKLANVIGTRGRTKEAERAYRRAIANIEVLVSQYPNVPGYRQNLSLYSSYLATCLQSLGQKDEANALRHSARNLCEKLEGEFEQVSDRLHHLGLASRNLTAAGDLEGAEHFLRRSLELASEFKDEASREPSARQCLTLTSGMLAVALQSCGRIREAANHFRDAVSISERLALEFPDDSAHRYQLARHLNYLGVALRYLPSEAANAMRCHHQTIEICERLVSEFPDQPMYRRELVRSRFGLGLALRVSGRLGEAVEAFGQAQQDYRPFTATTDDDVNRVQFASTYNELAWLRATCPDMNFRDTEQAVSLARKAVELAPEKGEFWNTLGVALYRTKDWTQSRAALTSSTGLRKGGDPFDWFFLAMAAWQLGQREIAQKWYQQSVGWMEKNHSTHHELLRFRAEAEELLQVKGQAPLKTKHGPATGAGPES
jgi:tetratricopeptide (TPR) repeat protein